MRYEVGNAVVVSQEKLAGPIKERKIELKLLDREQYDVATLTVGEANGLRRALNEWFEEEC